MNESNSNLQFFLSMPIIVLFCATIFNETIKKKLILINTIIDFEI